MSWGEYLQGGSGLMNHYQKIESCGIFGHNGSTWAQVGMDHTQQYYNEITDLVGLFTDPSSGYSKGFTLNNIQFALLRVEDDKIIHGKGKNAPNFTRISLHTPPSPHFIQIDFTLNPFMSPQIIF